MFVDTSLAFSSYSAPVAITATSASAVVDVAGVGSGTAPSVTYGIGPAGYVFGADLGNGDGCAIPVVIMAVTTAFVSAGGATLQVQVESSIDDGSNAPSSFTVIAETETITAANLAAGKLLAIPLPPVSPGQSKPRFYRLNYVVGTSTFSAGKVSAGLVINPPSSLVGSNFASNF